MRAFLLAALLVLPSAFAGEGRTELALLAAIHGNHLRSKAYGVDRVVALVRAFRPDVVLVEIPPDLFDGIVERVDRRGFATTREDVADVTWIRAFPELYAGVLPLRKEMGYAVVPVSGWRAEANRDRDRFWKGPGRADPYPDRKRIHDAVLAALREIQERENAWENPGFVNSLQYADLRHLERAAWAACFDEGLGAGGERAINEAHWANIAKALDAHRGKRVLLVYGAAHHYWFRRELAKRMDVDVVPLPR